MSNLDRGMRHAQDLIAKAARLPNGQEVRIEATHADGYATVRRVEGERHGTLAVCAIAQLASLQPSMRSER